MAGIQNIGKGFDAFADAEEDTGDNTKVHVRVQQRNGRKCITTIQGLADDLDIKRICKAFKKNFSCNGAVTKDEEMGEVIQLSGDQVCACAQRARGVSRGLRGGREAVRGLRVLMRAPLSPSRRPQRTNVKDFLTDQEICTSAQIVLHGF